MMPLRPPSLFLITACACMLASALPRPASAQTEAFGVKEGSEAALIGILYDLKQTQDRKKTAVNTSTYSNVVDNFLSRNWDEAVLNEYYRVSRPLYTTQIYIPLMNAGSAPKAFEAEKTVEPSRWLIHYKGQVTAPEAGRYRFVGYADDWLAVAVNNKTVLVSNRADLKLTKTNWNSKEPDGMAASNGRLRFGDWIDFKKDESVDLDIAVGERPGGQFSAFLLVQKEGEVYEKSHSGAQPILPIFQLVPKETPEVPVRLGPPFAKNSKPWKALQ